MEALEMYESIHLWIGCVFTGLISITGVIGNIFTILIVHQSYLWKSIFYKLIFILACFDNITIVTNQTYTMHCYIVDCEASSNSISYVYGYLQTLGLFGSVYMTVVISFERYLALCCPQVLWRRKFWAYLVIVVGMAIMHIIVPLVAGTFLSKSFLGDMEFQSMDLGGAFQ